MASRARGKAPDPPKSPAQVVQVDMEVLLNNFEKRMEARFQSLQDQLSNFANEITGDIKNLRLSVNQLRDQSSSVKAKTEALGIKVGDLDKQLMSQADQLDFLELKAKEHILRFRSIQETSNEHIRERMVIELSKFLQEDRQLLDSEIDKVFRVNSRFATQNKAPRDILIFFVKKNTRDRILQLHSKNKFKIDNKDVIVLKEIPQRILQRRKDFTFLVQKLKENNISFKWENLYGLNLNYQRRNYRINTVEDAQKFLEKVDLQKQEPLKGGSSLDLSTTEI
ncbi:hypothetical protein JRQ81_003300 [Phrynocephalus forsythii]|uniref:Uncharacterized protein n=1 Tax=Phrynocephalus forsythii TaxID=171643 RepID=A0A9Q0XLS4_9SAUR|nr:hypothetical protein JRQ81_003300 [Phrynocephalus forsythii]